MFFTKNNPSKTFVILVISIVLMSCSSGSDDPTAPTNTGPGATPVVLVPPEIVNIQSDTTKIIIDWPLETTIDHYLLYWSTTSGTGTTGTKIVLDPKVHSYNHEFLVDDTTPIATGTEYFYSVSAVRDSKESALSSEVSATLKDINKPVPGIPQNPKVNNQNTSIIVSWDNDAAVINYNLYWSTTKGAGISGTKVTLPSGQTSFKHEFIDAAKTPLAAATDYFYVVTAQNSNGESINSVEVVGRLVEAPIVVLPQPPAIITVTPQNSQIQLQWDLDPTVVNYNVYWSSTKGTGINGTKVSLLAGVHNFSHEFLSDNKTRLSNGVDFYYVVTAQDANNESIPSTEVTARLKNKPWLMPLLNSVMEIQ